jgi:hypothetical protein
MAFPTNLTQAQIDYLQKLGTGGQIKESIGDKVAYLVKAINLLTAKLDADAGVTDTNYAALVNALTIP